MEDANRLPRLDRARSGGPYARQRVAPARAPHTRAHTARYEPCEERVWPAQRGLGGLAPFLVWGPGTAAVSGSDGRTPERVTCHAPRGFCDPDSDAHWPWHHARPAAYPHLRRLGARA